MRTSIKALAIGVLCSLSAMAFPASPTYSYRVIAYGLGTTPGTEVPAGGSTNQPPADPYAADVLSELDFEDGFSDKQGHAYAGSGVSLVATAKNGASAAAFSGAGALSTAIPGLNVGMGSFTFEAWVNPTTTAHAGVFSTAAAFGGQLSVRLYAGRLNVFTGGAGGGDAYIVGAASIPTGAWTHIAVVRDGTTFRTYVNGLLDGQQAGVTTNLTTSTAYIGTERNYYFQGSIDDVRFTKNAVRYP